MCCRMSLQALTLPETRAAARDSFKMLLTSANNDASVRPPRTFGQAAQLTRSARQAVLPIITAVEYTGDISLQSVPRQCAALLGSMGINGWESLKRRTKSCCVWWDEGLAHVVRMGAGVRRSSWSAGQPMTGRLCPCPPWRLLQLGHLSCNPAWLPSEEHPSCQPLQLPCLGYLLHHQTPGHLASILW